MINALEGCSITPSANPTFWGKAGKVRRERASRIHSNHSL